MEESAEKESFDLMRWAMESTEEATAELEKVTLALVVKIHGVEEEDINTLKETMVQFQKSDFQELPKNAVEMAANSSAAAETL